MIEVVDLVKDFGAVRAVDHVTFRVEPGEIVGFLGPNGAGKTTTIRVLTCYHAATSGMVRVHGLDVLSHSLEVRAGLGYLPENVPIYPDLRVEEYLRFRAASKGVGRREIKARVDEVMEMAGVLEVRRKLVGQVSRGYRQRVGLADVLVANPPLLLLDEPTSGLDPNQRRRVRERIGGLRGRHTILFSSHILADVEAVCSRIVLIHRGRLRADGTLAELGRRAGGRQLRLRVKLSPELSAGALLEGLPLVLDDRQVVTEEDGFAHLSCPLMFAPGDDEEDVERAALDACYRRLREARGCELREMYVHTPTLEEIFYHLTEGIDQEEAAIRTGSQEEGSQEEGPQEEGTQEEEVA